MNPWHTVAAVSAALALGGCPQPGDPADPGVDSDIPMTVENHLVYLSRVERQAVLVDVAADEPRVRRVSLPEGVCQAQQRPGSGAEQLVILCQGLDATVDRDVVPAELLLLDRGGIERRYELPGRFASFALSEDGDHAFVFDAQGGIVLATETAFVDLDARPSSDNPQGVTVRSLAGESPTGAAFSPPMEVAGEKRRFAVTLSPGHINLFDLAHLDRGAITVPLTVDGTSAVFPEQVVFGKRTVYVRASGLNHVIALTLYDAQEEGGPHPFAPGLSTLALGQPVSHLLLLDGEEEAERILALTPSKVAVVDLATGTSVEIAVSQGFTDAVRFRGGSPGDDNVSERALLYGSHRAVGFLDLERLEILQDRNLETVAVQADVRGAYPMVEQGRVALLHGDPTLLSVVELEDRTVVPVRTQVSLQNALVDPERTRLWLDPDGSQIASLNLSDLSASEVLLDATVIGLALVPGEESTLVAVHRDSGGFVTLLDADAPKRSTARSLRGFLWEGLLDERTVAR